MKLCEQDKENIEVLESLDLNKSRLFELLCRYFSCRRINFDPNPALQAVIRWAVNQNNPQEKCDRRVSFSFNQSEGGAVIDDTIHNFIQTSARTFKHFYGIYPERLGLDTFTRMKKYNELHFFEYYCWQEMSDIEMVAPFRESIIRYERVQIRIDPAVFGKIEYYPDTPVVNWNKPPERGYDEVLCEGNGVTAFITLWFTGQGYHAIIWDEEK